MSRIYNVSIGRARLEVQERPDHRCTQMPSFPPPSAPPSSRNDACVFRIYDFAPCACNTIRNSCVVLTHMWRLSSADGAACVIFTFTGVRRTYFIVPQHVVERALHACTLRCGIATVFDTVVPKHANVLKPQSQSVITAINVSN